MTLGARAKRLTYLFHRWTGVAGCLLMAIWFLSGVVMLYVGYPKLTPWERLGALPELNAGHCCLPLSALAGQAGAVTLTSVRGMPHYVLRTGGKLHVLSAATGQDAGPVSEIMALAEASAFAPGAPLRPGGEIQEDRWTHSGALNAHRPLYQVFVLGQEPATLYVSSVTGQVVLDAPQSQQRWNYVGAWLHWLYFLRNQPADPTWSWIVIALSAMGTISALTGAVIGIWRWRFHGRYKSGSHTPYREPWMRWHHIAGLIFSACVCTWIFSGLMSMNPVEIFAPSGARPDVAAYRGAAAPIPESLEKPAAIIRILRDAGFRPVELQWRQVGGSAYVLAYDARAQTRLVYAGERGLTVAESWTVAQLMPAARHLFAEPIGSHRPLSDYDAYYYQRNPEAMNGALQHGLPALQLDYTDPGRTRVYIDLRTGDTSVSLSRSQRVGRWLFNFLHSWDMPALLRHDALREIVLILLSVGGFIVCCTGVVIGWRRLRRPPRHIP